MTNLQHLLDELEKLEKAGTPGPWSARPVGSWDQIPCVSVDNKEPNDLGLLLFVGKTFGEYQNECFAQQSDAELIAQSRNALPIIIAFCRDAVEVMENAHKLGQGVHYEEVLEFRERWGIGG